MDGEYRVEEVREADTVRLGYQTEQGAIAVKTPWSALFSKFKSRFIIAVQKFVGDFAGRRLIGEFKRFRPIPLDVNHRHETVWEETTYDCIGLEVFEPDHSDT
jgi:hypothetical protein